MGRTDSHAGFALQLRLLGRRGLATLLCLLRRWAGNLKPGAASVGPEVHHRIRRRNRALQEELRQVFAPLHRLCPECGSQCCREVEIPFSRLDGLLYGWRREGSPAQSGEKVPTVLSCLRRDYLYEKLKKFSRGSRTQPGGLEVREDGPSFFCPALGEGGCLLPWGERPAVCVFCACPQFLAEMSWGDYGRYISASARYLAHLARSLAEFRVR